MEVLEQIGLTKTESKIYLVLLDSGLSTTGPLMSAAKVSSSKIYVILERLIQKGLVSYIVKSKTKYYQACSPKNLLNYMVEKESKLKAQTNLVKNIIPELELRKANSGSAQDAQVYIGWKGVKSAFEYILDSMKEGDDYIGFAQTDIEESSKEVRNFFNHYQSKRMHKKLNVKLLAQASQKKLFAKDPYTKFKSFQVRYLERIPPGMVICKSMLLMPVFTPQTTAVLIHSKSLAKTYTAYFNFLWETTKKHRT